MTIIFIERKQDEIEASQKKFYYLYRIVFQEATIFRRRIFYNHVHHEPLKFALLMSIIIECNGASKYVWSTWFPFLSSLHLLFDLKILSPINLM